MTNDTNDTNTITIIKFSSPTCSPCRRMDGELEQLIIDSPYHIVIEHIDITRKRDLAVANGVCSVPTLVVKRQGKECWRVVGYKKAEDIQEGLRIVMEGI